MSAHTITTPEQEQVLRQAATLSRMLQQTWSRADSYDVVMLLVAELLEAHADTGIDLGTWPVPPAAAAGQCVVETAIGAWWRQIQAPSAADAVGFAIRSPA